MTLLARIPERDPLNSTAQTSAEPCSRTYRQSTWISNIPTSSISHKSWESGPRRAVCLVLSSCLPSFLKLTENVIVWITLSEVSTLVCVWWAAFLAWVHLWYSKIAWVTLSSFPYYTVVSALSIPVQRACRLKTPWRLRDCVS